MTDLSNDAFTPNIQSGFLNLEYERLKRTFVGIGKRMSRISFS